MQSRNDSSRRKGFRTASSVLERRLRDAGESRGFAVTRLLTHWGDIVGKDLADVTTPVKVSYGKGGFGATLVLLVRGAHAQLVEMQKETLRAKVNACYGYNAIARVKFTQTAPTGFREGQAVFHHKDANGQRPRNPEFIAKANSAVEDVADDGLRAALAEFGENVLHGKKVKQ